MGPEEVAIGTLNEPLISPDSFAFWVIMIVSTSLLSLQSMSIVSLGVNPEPDTETGVPGGPSHGFNVMIGDCARARCIVIAIDVMRLRIKSIIAAKPNRFLERGNSLEKAKLHADHI